MKDARRIWAAVLLGVAMAAPLHAQDEEAGPCDKPTNKEVLKLLEAAARAKDPAERHQKLKATQEVDPECMECLFQLGISAYNRASAGAGNFDAGIGYLEKVREKCPDHHSDLYYYLGTMYYAQDKFPEAAQAFDKFLKFPSDDPSKMAKDVDKKTSDVNEVMPELQFHADFYRDTRPFNPVVMRGVCTGADEYLPMFSPDNELLFFTRVKQVQAKGDIVSKAVEELTEARRPDVKADFDQGKALPDPFNTGDSYGGVTVSVNNKEMFVTVCTPVPGTQYRNCDIFRTHYDSRVDFGSGKVAYEWTALEDLGPSVNTPDGWESQPTLSADGRTLYFATVRKDSKGTDIYMSTRDDKGQWGPAKPVPGPINTSGDEKAPFLHSDSHTLYFAARPPKDPAGKDDPTRGHRGIGGYDVFFSHLNDDGTWSKPRNIGNPINTPQDDHGLIVSADGRTAYFASSRFRGVGGLDIYGFELPKDARPEDVLLVKGEVRDEAGQLVKDAKVEIKYTDTQETEVIEVDGSDGRYATVLRLKPGADVVMTVKKEGHVFDSRVFSTEDTVRGGVAAMDMKVERIEVGRSYRVSDIRYATGKADVTKGSEHILDELIVFLRENPTIKIKIQGHTDNVGSQADNMALSHDRAFTVYSYLQEHGIAGARLAFEGYGPTKPIASNDTEEGRARNRRTEFVITSK
jgi:outer membrane protein OmpA-like peptidoglycan-associated protein/tetratricopeptide (TPR) repeat protein